MKKKLTVLSNIVCVVLMIATFASMLVPCWFFQRESKVYVRYCAICKTDAEMVEGTSKVREGYVCTGTVLVDASTLEEEKKEETPEATEPVTDATEPAAVDPTEATVEATVEATEPEATEPAEAEMVEVPCGNSKRWKLVQRPVYSDDEASVMEFVWLTFKNKDLSEKFVADGLKINDIVLIPFLVTLFSLAGLLFCLVNRNGTWHSIFPLGAGVMTIVQYLTMPVFQCETWLVTVGLAAALSVFGLILFAQFMTKIVKWFVVPCYKK